MAVTAPSGLPGNLLTLADSDFESGTPTWAALTNASAPSVSSAHSFSGAKSLQWTSSAAGDSFIVTGFYACTQNNGYDFSGYINTVTAGHDCYIGVQFYNSSHTAIGSPVFMATGNPTSVNTWQPLALAVTSPAGAAFFKVQVWVSTSVGSGETFAIDLMYASAPPAQVLVDFTNPAFVTGSLAGLDFADVSMWVRWDQPITMQHGRQDAISEIQSGQAQLTLQNDAGWFTPQLSTSPYFPNVSLGLRTQINVQDNTGTWNTRFDGPISQISYTVDTTGGTNTAHVSLSDVLAYMNRQDPLFCWTKEAVLYDSPFLHWTLDDTGVSGSAAETSGNNGPPLRLVDNATGGTPAGVTWRSSNGGVETLADASAPGKPDGSQFWVPGSVEPASRARGLVSGAVGPIQTPLSTIYFAPVLTAQSAQSAFVGTTGYQLNGELLINGVPAPIAPNTIGQNYSVECWFTQDPNIKSHLGQNLGPFTVLSLGSSRSNTCLSAGIAYSGSSTLELSVGNFNQPPAFANLAYNVFPAPVTGINYVITTDKVPLPHHLVIEITGGSPPTATVYLDSVNAGTFNLESGQAFDTICVGGAYGGQGNFYGNIALVSIYQYLLSGHQILQHCQAGQYGYWEAPTDNCIAAIGRLSGLPSFWNNLAGSSYGLSLTEYVSIMGSTPLTSMQLYERAEQGLLYVNTAGQLTFHTRDWRQGYGHADVTLPADTYTADLGYELIDTGLINEAATGSITYTQGVDFTNPASVAALGTYANGTGNAPNQLPLITWSRAYSNLGLGNTTTGTASPYGYYADPNLNDNTSWQVNTKGQPNLVCGQLTVDLLTLDPTSGLTVNQLYGLDIDNMVTLSGLPSSFPDQAGANDYFIEGLNETVGLGKWTLTMYTSPAARQRAWRPGDATYGQLGSTTRIGVSAPDVSVPPALGKSVAHDSGAPYWPPTFVTQPAAIQLGFVNTTALSPVIPMVFNGSTQGDAVLVQVLAAAAATITVTDSEGNSYSQIGNATLPGGQHQYVFISFGAIALNSTDTITLTTSVSQAYTASAYDVSGIVAQDGATVTSSGTSTTPNVTLPSGLSASNDWELVVISNVSNKTGSNPSGWTQFGHNFQSGTYDNQLFWKQATSTTGDSFTTTISASSAWAAVGIAFTVAPLSLNNPAGNGHGFVGANDIRGLANTLSTALNPPLLVLGMTSHATSYASGNNGVGSHGVWDAVYIDTAGGMGIVPAWPTWYCVMVPGFYEVSGSFQWQVQASGQAGVRAAWLIIAKAAAQAVAAGTGSPVSNVSYVCPIGEQSANTATVNSVEDPTTRVYLGVGDMVNLGVMQTQGSALNSATGSGGGPYLSLRWVGYNTADDQTPTAAAPGNGGVAVRSGGSILHTQSWQPSNTYAYYGTAFTLGVAQLIDTNGDMFQGSYEAATGSRFSFAMFNSHLTAIQTALTGATIKQVTVTLTNTSSYYGTGADVMVGYTTFTGSFGSTFTPSTGTFFDLRQRWFKRGQTQTVDLTDTGIGTAFQNGTATGLCFGNNKVTDPNYAGRWTGGTTPGTAPKLTITYVK